MKPLIAILTCLTLTPLLSATPMVGSAVPPTAEWTTAVGYVTQIAIVTVAISFAVALLIKAMAFVLRRSTGQAVVEVEPVVVED